MVVDVWNKGLGKIKDSTQQQLQQENLFCGFMGGDMFRSDTDEGLNMQKAVLSEMIRIGNELKDGISCCRNGD